MYPNRSYKRTFYSAPQSVTSLVAAFLEPTLSVATYVAIARFFDEPVLRSTLALCLITFALTFPGRNRFRDDLVVAGVDIVSNWAVLLAVLALCGYATRSLGYFEDRVLVAWAILTPLLQWGAVAVGRRVLERYETLPEVRRTAVIVGAGPLAAKVARALGEDPGAQLIGFFEDRGSDERRIDEDASRKVLGGLRDVAACVSQRGVRDVYITLPLSSQPRIAELLGQLQDTTASLFFVPDVFGISIIQGRLSDMNGVPVVGLCETPFTGTNGLAKRLSDIVLASLILLLISPLMIAIAIGVKLSSPGPVIFRQRRNGLDGNEIVIYKFRSMIAQDNGDVVRQARKHDPRITRFGRMLRRASLDELPQFINVLQGRMSIVGPRPHAVAHNEEYRQVIRAYMVRHKVKPGITGWAQVNGHRGETDTLEKMRARVEYDLEYLRNWSIGLDLQIIVRTIGLVFADRHAY
jgi:putative colanic acid biosynthesis UDP-glucose lipid carrier transferase